MSGSHIFEHVATVVTPEEFSARALATVPGNTGPHNCACPTNRRLFLQHSLAGAIAASLLAGYARRAATPVTAGAAVVERPADGHVPHADNGVAAPGSVAPAATIRTPTNGLDATPNHSMEGFRRPST